MTLITPYALFGWTALFQISMVIFIVYRMRVRKEVSQALRSRFADTLIQIQTVLPIPTPTRDDPTTGVTDEHSPDAEGER
jgi:hypothetical protein